MNRNSDVNLGVYRVNQWNEYKKRALDYKPTIIFYSRDPHPTCRPPWGLRLIFYNGFDTYVFIDYAEETLLHKTGIPIRGKDKGEIPILVKDIETFLHSQIGKVKISPIWFPG